MVRFVNVLTTLAGNAALAVLAVLIGYTVRNGSGHTGFEPWLLSVIFVPVIIIGLSETGEPALRRPAVFALAAGILGMATLWYLDSTNTLLQYERWIQRGMP